VDSGWLADGEPDAATLAKPSFPTDPAVPADIARPASEAPKVSEARAPVTEPPAKQTPSSSSPASVEPSDSERASSKRKPAEAANERRVSRHAEPVATQKGGSRWIGLLLLVVAAGGIALVKGRGQENEAALAEPTKVQDPDVTSARTPQSEPAALPALSAAPSPEVVAELPAPAASEVAPAVPSSSAAAAPAPSESASEPAPPTGTKQVVIDVMPPEARVYYRGKSVGKPPVTIELEPGKRRSFEVAAPGYTTRKIIVDGSKPKLSVGLRPVPASTDAARTP
jgi:DNA polymerase III gamma/tau subunit